VQGGGIATLAIGEGVIAGPGTPPPHTVPPQERHPLRGVAAPTRPVSLVDGPRAAKVTRGGRSRRPATATRRCRGGTLRPSPGRHRHRSWLRFSPRPAPVAALPGGPRPFGPRGRNVSRVVWVPLRTRRVTAAIQALASGASALSGVSVAAGRGDVGRASRLRGAVGFLPPHRRDSPLTRVDQASRRQNVHSGGGYQGRGGRGRVDRVWGALLRDPGGAGTAPCRQAAQPTGAGMDVSPFGRCVCAKQSSGKEDEM
jgi:hypothetical protein